MKDSTEVLLESSRFWFQKVLVPILVCIGFTGNTITVMVLTRKRMRSSTNIYLSALAIADIIYLFFVLLLSFQHYNNINDRKYELYWRFFGLSHWLCDAASSTSVWLTVSFTIERYIAVCHPIKGKYLCTESRAKTVTAIVYIFCILTTASTTFEYQLALNDTVTCGGTDCKIEPTKKPASLVNSTNANITYVPNKIVLTKSESSVMNHSSIIIRNDPNLTTILKNILSNCSSNHPHIIYVYPDIYNVTVEPNTKVETVPNMTVVHQLPEEQQNVSLVDSDDQLNSTNSCCTKKYWIDVESTNLGKNQTYSTFIHWYSALFFGLFPLVLIATFNCFLIRAVYVSQIKRRAMTNSNAQNQSQENMSMSNENRITLMLIAVVAMFLLCQVPTATYLIYYNFRPAQDRRQRNIQATLGNIFNFLITVNASCNFLLYSIMSKKFRRTLKKLCWEREMGNQDTIAMSSTKSRSSQKFNPYKHGINRNASEYHTPRNLETQSLTGVPRSKSLMSRHIGKVKSTDLIV